MTVQEAQVDDLHEPGEEEFVDELTPGTKLMHGQYTIESFLNSGGFGITYLARDSLDRLVVIKECFPGSFCRRQNASVVARSRAHQAELRSIVRLFTQEARSLAKAGHPNVVGVHQVFEDNSTAYMALDYIEGMDLLEIITETPNVLTPEQIRSYLVKMLDAVSFVHAQGILHRDISPDNILIRGDNEPVLIDFGAAREEASKQSRLLSALRVVKDGYSPQEFYVAGSEQSNSCDLYSLAASFYHIITGELPPDSQTRLAAAAAGDVDPYVSLSDRTNDYDETFCKALDKAMSVLPRERIQSAEEWAAMLSGETPVPAPVERTKNVSRALNVGTASSDTSNKMPLLMGSTAAVLAVAAVGYFAMQGGAEDETASSVAVETPIEDTPFVAGAQPELVETVEAPTGATQQDAPPAFDAFDGDLGIAAAPDLPSAVTETPFVNQSETAEPLPPQEEAVAEADNSLPFGVELTTPDAPQVASNDLPTGVELTEPNATDVQLPEGVEFVAPEGSAPEQVATAQPEVTEQPAPVTDTTSAQIAASDVTGVMGGIVVPSLPFTLSETNPGVVDNVLAGAPFWLAEGTRILSIDGQPVENTEQANDLVKTIAAQQDGSSILLNLATEAQVSGAAIDRTITLPIVNSTVLLNGLGFESQAGADGVWTTTVTAVPNGSSFEVGDTVFAYIPTSERIEGANTLREIIERDLQAGTSEFNFAIRRDGQIWVESFTLTN